MFVNYILNNIFYCIWWY